MTAATWTVVAILAAAALLMLFGNPASQWVRQRGQVKQRHRRIRRDLWRRHRGGGQQ